MNEDEVLPDTRWWQMWPGSGCRCCGGFYWHSWSCKHSRKFRERMNKKCKQEGTT